MLFYEMNGDICRNKNINYSSFYHREKNKLQIKGPFSGATDALCLGLCEPPHGL